MKYTKTTIRELSARYRGILKKCFLLNALALGLFAVTAAKADTGVWQTAINGTDAFMDNLELAGWNRGTDPVTGWGVDQILAVMAPAATATDEAIAKLNSIDAEKPVGTNYTYKAPDGTDVTLNKDGTTATGAGLLDYVGTSAADGEIVTTSQTIAHDATQDKDNYSFASTAFVLDSGAFTFNSNNELVVDTDNTSTAYSAGEPGVLSGTYTLANKAVDGTPTELTIKSSDAAAPTIDAKTYDVLITATPYHLSEDASKLLDTSGNDVTASFQTQYEALKAKYDADKTRVENAWNSVVAAADTNKDNYDAAKGVYDADKDTIKDLTDNYATLSNGSETGASQKFAKDQASYNTSLGKVIDTKANSAVNTTVGDMHAVTLALKGESYEGDDLTVSGAFQEVMTQAETIFSQKQQWVDDTLGIESAKKDAVKKAYADTNYLTETTTLTGADKALDAQIKTNANAIALKANAADVYTKAEAEAIFYEKQQWVDDTLGIESAKKDAVKKAYTGTNYLTETTTLTGADIVLDGQIKTINNTLGEGFDTGDNTVAKVITAKANAAESNAKEYAKGYTDTVVAGLDAELSQAAGTDGLALSITEVDGKITAISGSIAANTYDAYGAAGTAETNAKNYTDSKIETLSGEVDDTVGDLSSLEDLAFFKGKAKTAGAGAAAVGDSSVTELLTNLNDNLSSEFARVDRRIDKLETKLEKGLAANNALAGLVPLDHVHKTQVSAALGGYKNNQALAVGAFHYLNDRTLLNAGAAYGGNDSVSYKVGVTFGF